MVTESRRAPLLTRCLALNALALAFSLSHVMGDYGLVGAFPGISEWVLAGYLALAGAVYGWWGWSLGRAGRDGRSGLLSLMIFSGVWANVNGASLVFTAPPWSAPYPGVIHLGSLLFGTWAAYATWRLWHANRADAAIPTRFTGVGSEPA